MTTATSTAAPSWFTRLATNALLQVVALAIFVGFPALFTAIAPVSWVTLSRHDGTVSWRAQACLLFVVPYKTSVVSDVIGFGDRVKSGSVTRYRKPGRDRVTRSEDEGFLVVQGKDSQAEVQVSPASLDAVIERAEGFLNDPRATELSLFVVANWKFSVIGGGLVSLLTVFYVVTVTGGLVMKLVGVARALSGPSRGDAPRARAGDTHHQDAIEEL